MFFKDILIYKITAFLRNVEISIYDLMTKKVMLLRNYVLNKDQNFILSIKTNPDNEVSYIRKVNKGIMLNKQYMKEYCI